jgi:hypothetical protein
VGKKKNALPAGAGKEFENGTAAAQAAVKRNTEGQAAYEMSLSGWAERKAAHEAGETERVRKAGERHAAYMTAYNNDKKDYETKADTPVPFPAGGPTARAQLPGELSKGRPGLI